MSTRRAGDLSARTSSFTRGARITQRALVAVLSVSALVALAECTRWQEPQQRRIGTRQAEAFVPAVTIYDGKLGEGWVNYGWAARDLGQGPAHLEAKSYGGWIVAKPGLTGTYGALAFRMQAPRDWGDFLEVRVESAQRTVFPRVVVGLEHRVELPGDWTEVLIPMRALDPERLPFDRVVFRAWKSVGAGVASLDKIVLTKGDEADVAAEVLPSVEVLLTVDCSVKGTPISPLIYGIAYDARLDAKDKQQWLLGATGRRWGGNAASRFNWRLGNAWNTASDWFFENVNYTGDPSFSWTTFLDAQRAHGMSTALTVPMLGWVAKDTSSYSFPVATGYAAKAGPQQAQDPYKPDAGNGKSPDGKPLAVPPPTQTSVASTPESIGKWVRAIRARDAKLGARSVDVYVLDNEPMLWNSTHRDVHPEPVGYDELLTKTIEYGEVVRAEDPDAVIAGPALWGWPAYLFSAIDAKLGFHVAPDRKAHGDVPLLAWWLREVRAHERKVGHRLIDLVDVHFYPQGENVGGAEGGTDAATSAKRIRSTRALWDPTYLDESWIADRIELVPRVKRWIAENAPGMGVQIGEWNFGAETHPSGGLAVAETLGRFGQQGVTSAFYWTYPPEGSPAFWAFRAFRNFDGAGGRFLDWSLPAKGDEGTSVFVSRDATGGHMVAIVLNLRNARPVVPKLTLGNAPKIKSVRLFRYAGEPTGFALAKASAKDGEITSEPLPGYSIAVFDILLEVKP
jgi:hypothetical protein